MIELYTTGKTFVDSFRNTDIPKIRQCAVLKLPTFAYRQDIYDNPLMHQDSLIEGRSSR